METAWGISALVLGLVGSLHCIGMCGPIALALPVGNLSAGGKWLAHLLYPLGRITTYAVLGVAAGAVGKGFSLLGLQQPLSIFAGVLLLAMTLWPRLSKRLFPRAGAGFPLREKLVFFWRQPGTVKFYVIGMINGLLPCGMVYMALLGSLTAPSLTGSAAFMALFGLGTSPALAGILLGGQLMGISVRKKLARAIPVVAVVFAVLFILRGLGLGIPYLSPAPGSLEIVPHEQTAPSCH